MVSTIYEPSGKAREYSPLALNVYQACDHDCKYCYARRMWGLNTSPRKGLLEALSKRLESGPKVDRQVLLSFLCDPYCVEESRIGFTRQVLSVLADYDVPVSILTKGGSRALRDLDLFKRFSRFQLGATLTCDNPFDSQVWEPKAALPEDRLAMLREAHDSGLRTFVSFEPVILPEQSLRMMALAAPYTQHYKIGRWNHDSRANSIDWPKFAHSSVEFCRSASKVVYIKDDLAKALPSGFLRNEERNPDLMEI